MNDRKLADAVVELGVGKANQIYPDALGRFYQIDPDADWQTSVNEAKFVRDWRVAGALIEETMMRTGRIPSQWFCPHTAPRSFGVMLEDANGRAQDSILNESLPRAIIEAMVKDRCALSK